MPARAEPMVWIGNHATGIIHEGGNGTPRGLSVAFLYM